MARLIVTSGPLAGRRYEIDREVIVGGGDAALRVVDDEASPRHAALRIVGDELEVEDLGSGGGTWVDGERIDQPRVLHDGATLRIGTTSFIVEIDAPTGDRHRTQPMLAAVALPPLARPTSPPPPAAYVAPKHARRRRADTRLWMPAAATFAAIIATALALVIYFALR